MMFSSIAEIFYLIGIILPVLYTQTHNLNENITNK